MNKPINYPLDKLCKEKGFDEPCPNLYYQPEKCKKPTIADVVMWLYEKHKIWITVNYLPKYKIWDYQYTNINWSEEEVASKLKQDVNDLLDDLFQPKGKFNSPTEAYEAAIEFTLTKLI
jgi:hypothetical protein